MSSQDTMAYAQTEAENAKIIRQQIEKNQADITAMQHDSKASEMQSDIQTKFQVNEGLERKYQEHMSNYERLQQEALSLQKREQEERLQEQQKNQDGIKKTVKEVVKSTLF